jgi:NAD(P)-dependent dehydrogenase (short-subunit alcohol dehydrogenase family)
MNIDLTGQTSVVTGAGRGIGLAVTRALTASGAHVIAGTRHSCAELDQLAAEGIVTTFEVDLAVLGARPEDVASGAAGAMITGRFSRPEELADLVLLPVSREAGGRETRRP